MDTAAPHRALALAMTLAASAATWAHGTAGARFFPSPLGIEDPFAQHELSIVTSHIREPGHGDEAAADATETELELGLRIADRLALSLGGAYAHLDPVDEAPAHGGFGNLEVGLKYQVLASAEHEAAVAVAFSAEVGGTGDADAEADSFSTFAPALLFAKGLGDLPEGAGWLRAAVLYGSVGARVPEEAGSRRDGEGARNPLLVDWAVGLGYDLGYLSANVRDVGLPAFARRLTPLVEVVMRTCANRGCGGETSGFVNPGVVWRGRYLQLGVEAQVPVNDRSGENVGVLAQLHLYLDDLVPALMRRAPPAGRQR